MITRRFLVIAYSAVIISFLILFALAYLNLKNPQLVWVGPLFESLFITGSLIITYVMLARGFLISEKWSTVTGLAFLITIVPTIVWLLSWHNIVGQSFIPTSLSTHIWILLSRDFLFVLSYLVMTLLIFKINLNVKQSIFIVIAISLLLSIFLVTSPFLPDIIVGDNLLPMHTSISYFIFFFYLIAIIFTIYLYRKKIARPRILLSFILYLIIYSEGLISFALSTSRFDLLWFYGKSTNLLAFGILISSLIAEYTGYFIESFVARSVQAGFKPKVPQVDWFEFDAQYRPSVTAATIGGDWFDIMQLDKDNILLILGDAVGKGLEAISTMTEAKFLLRSFVLEGKSIDEAFFGLNNYLFRYLKSEEFVTVAAVLLSKDADNFKYVLAGHPPPLVISEKGWRKLDIKSPRMPLGIAADTGYPVLTSHIGHGEILSIYSDGVVEARKGDQFFGENNLANFIFENRFEDLNTIDNELLVNIQSRWRIVDDLTIILIRLR